MAAIQKRNDSYRLLFRHHGKQHAFTLGRVSEAEAKAKADQVEYLLRRLAQGLLTVPNGVDIVTFVRCDGSVPNPAVVTRDAPTLTTLRDRYLETHQGSLEHHTLRGIRRHFRHLVRFFLAFGSWCARSPFQAAFATDGAASRSGSSPVFRQCSRSPLRRTTSSDANASTPCRVQLIPWCLQRSETAQSLSFSTRVLAIHSPAR